MSKSKEKEAKGKKVKTEDLSRLLRRVYLNGVVEEALVDFGEGTVEAVDATNSLFLHCDGGFKLPDLGGIGLGDLSLMCRYLDAAKDKETVRISKEDNRLILKSAGAELRYLTNEEEFISTVVKGGGLRKLFKPCVCSVEFSEAACKKYLMYSGLVKPKSIDFTIADGQVTLSGGLESEHQFSFNVGEVKILGEKTPKKIEAKIYAHIFTAICSVLEFKEDEPPILLFAPEHPVIVQQDKDNFWALLSLNEAGEEEGGDE